MLILDAALLRPGRFDRQVTVNLPDRLGRVEILKVHSRNKPLSEDVSLVQLANRTPGFSGADLANFTKPKKIIKSKVEKIYLALDEDALKDAFNHAETFMSYGKRVYLIEMGDKDPSELGFKAFTKLLHSATELTTSILMKKRLALS